MTGAYLGYVIDSRRSVLNLGALRGDLCYVEGCYAPTYLTTRHQRFGRVTCCPGHDPHRYGQGAPIVAQAAIQAPPQAAQAEPADPHAREVAQLTELEMYRKLFRQFLGLGQGSDGGPSSVPRVPVRPVNPQGPPPSAALDEQDAIRASIRQNIGPHVYVEDRPLTDRF